MIVKDEIDYIFKCLKSIEGIADEIVVVDTGSTDGTIQLIESRFPQVRLYHHPWEKNFSLHRNQSISYATGDWILFIDADEELFGDTDKLKNFLDTQSKKVTAVSFIMHDMNGGKSIMQFRPLKAFRNGHIQFKNIVHNQPITDGLASFCPFVFFKHYGYDIPEEKKILKVQRTEELLKLRIQENPKDFEAYFYLSQLYGWVEKWEEALACCMVYIENKKHIKPFNYAVFFSAARICIAKLPNHMDQAKKILDLAYKKDLDILLVLSEYYAITQDYPKLKQSTFQFLKEYKQFKGEPYFIHCHTPEAYLYCATNYVMCLLREGILTLLPDFQGLTLKCIDNNLKALLQKGVNQNE